MTSINDFKAALIGGGARANQFRVTITPPSGIAIGLAAERTSLLCRASTLPAHKHLLKLQFHFVEGKFILLEIEHLMMRGLQLS